MKENKLFYNFMKLLYLPLLKLIFRPKVFGKENISQDEGLILAGNHKCALDPIMVTSNTKRFVHFIAKEEVTSGILKKAFDLMGVIRVYKNRAKNVASILEAKNVLKNNGTLGIFPEGTRNRTDQPLLKFRKGTVTIAQDNNTPIVPFAIRGNYRPFRKGLEIEFGTPIDISSMTKFQANEYLRDEVLKLLKKNSS